MKILLPLLIAAAVATGWLLWPVREDQPLKQLESVPVTPEIQTFMTGALDAIRTQDARRLFRLLSSRDEVRFEEYRKMLFAAPDFGPADLIGARRLKASAGKAVSVLVKSRPRDKVYQFNLIPVRKSFAIVSIIDVR